MMVLSAGGLGLLISLSNPSILLIEDDPKTFLEAMQSRDSAF